MPELSRQHTRKQWPLRKRKNLCPIGGEWMQSRIFLWLMILSLVACSEALSQERHPTGEVSLTPAQVDIKGNRAKFNEYRDVRGGVYGHIGLHDDAEKTYLDFGADDIGHRDQKYELGGGRPGSYSYYLGYEEIPHNFNLNTTLHR